MPLTPPFFHVRDAFLRIGMQAVNYLLLSPKGKIFFVRVGLRCDTFLLTPPPAPLND